MRGRTTIIRIAVVLVTCALVSTGAPQKRPEGRPLIWDEPVQILHKNKANRTPRKKRRRVERAPLLTLEWRVLKQGDDLTAQPASPQAVFYDDDTLRLEFRTNQDGYLYIISQTEAADGRLLSPPELIFPDSQIDNGQNLVTKNTLYTVPPAGAARNPRDLWFKLAPPAGREVFVVIFTRDMIADIVDGFVRAATQDEKRAYMEKLKVDSGQKVERKPRPKGAGDGDQFVTWVVNGNRNDNEELIETIVLVHETRPALRGGV